MGLGLAAGAGTWGVLQWAGTEAGTAVLTSVAVAVVVPAAAWAAARLPRHDEPPRGEQGQHVPGADGQPSERPGGGSRPGPGHD